jgi:glutamate carboxypeptidase
MDPNALPFNADTMLEGLREWVECESPTFDAASVNRMMDLASRALVLAGARIERIAGRMGFGDCVRATFPHSTPHEPGILVMGHLDTVHPIGTLAKLPFRREGNKAWGPGIQDMKGGNYLSLEAIRQLQRTGQTTKLPITVLFTSDEEVGSPSTRDLIEAEAARHKYVLVPEPARPDGGVVTGRYAIARFNLEATGRPSHAGARPGDGRSAIREMARKLIEIEDMTTESCTFSVGVVHGGQWVNCVSTTCTGEALSMAKKQEDLDRGVTAMLNLRASSNEVQFKVTRGVTRPVWEPDTKGRALYEAARGVARRLGYDITSQSSGGGSDGNFTGAMGIATLDGLGVAGQGAHTLDEHIQVDSLAYRGKLMAGLLMALA